MHDCRVILAPPPLLLLCDLSGPVMLPEKQILVLEACQDTLKPEGTMAEGTTQTGHTKPEDTMAERTTRTGHF